MQNKPLSSLTKAELIAQIKGTTVQSAEITDLQTRLLKARQCFVDQKSEISGLQKLLDAANPSKFYKAKTVLTGAAKVASQNVQARASRINEKMQILRQLVISAASADNITAAKKAIAAAQAS